MTAKKKAEPKPIKLGDTVEYNGVRYQVTDVFGSGKYVVIENKIDRYSVVTDHVKKVE